MTRKRKAERVVEATVEAKDSPTKKVKQEDSNDAPDIAKEYEDFCKAIRDNLSIEQLRDILKLNGQDPSGPDDIVACRCQDLLFYGAMLECTLCGGTMEYNGSTYSCTGTLSEWSTCTRKTRNPPRKDEHIILPNSVLYSLVSDLLMKCQDPRNRYHNVLPFTDKPFAGMVISLSRRLSRTHQYWKREIEQLGGKVANPIFGVKCLVVSSKERERGGTSKVSEALERGIPIVREAWLNDSIKKQEPQPLDAYDCSSDFSTKDVSWDKPDPSEEAIESLSTELKMYGKRGVYRDTLLQQQGGKILEKDSLLYNCAFVLCDLGRGIDEFAITQLITVPGKKLHLYYTRGRAGDDTKAEERLEEWEDKDGAIKEFIRLFEVLTDNEFMSWEREKKFQKKSHKFHVIDMDDAVDVRYGGLGLRQLGAAVAHSKLDPMVADFMKVLCSQEIYRYAFMEMGLDSRDLPMGMLSNVHLKRRMATEEKAEALWSNFSSKWFTMMHSTRPFILKDLQELAYHSAAPLEMIRDVTVASHLIRDMTGATLDDPLFHRYSKLGCSITPVERESDEYRMILDYLEKSYEPFSVGDISYGVSAENIYAVESSAGPSFEDMKKLPNKVLLWCGTRSSNLLRHLQKGFMPAICSVPAPGYMFGRAIVCADTSAEAARYSFSGVDRPEGFLVLAAVSLGDEMIEVTAAPEDTKVLEERKMVVKGIGRSKTEESEHFVWKDDIKVPCGFMIPAEPEYKGSIFEYNKYAIYDPQQLKICFLVGVRYEEDHVVMDDIAD